jgi:hypothetical protein
VPALAVLGQFNVDTRNYVEASRHLEDALAVSAAINDPSGEATALCSLGALHTQLRHDKLAIDHPGQALTWFHSVGDRTSEVCAGNGLAKALLLAGDPIRPALRAPPRFALLIR